MLSLVPDLLVRGALTEQEARSVPVTVRGTPKEAQWLTEHTKVKSADLAQVIAARENLEYVDLDRVRIDSSAVSMVPVNVCRRHVVLPIAISDRGRIVLAMQDPTNVLAIDDAQMSSGRPITPVVAGANEILAAINKYHRSDKELNALTNALSEEVQSRHTETDTTGADDDSAPIVRVVNLLINQAIHDGASDIHIDPGERQTVVRYRVDGILHEVQRSDSDIHSGIVSRLKIMAGMNIAEKRVPQDGRFSVSTGDRKVDLRVATLPTVWGETVVMRLLDAKSAPVTLNDLGFEPDQLQTFNKAIHTSHGLVLVTGPTGSGKSTTLYAALREVATPEVNVITVEDPVEFRFAGINQVQVNAKAGMTFAAALRSILRADPDIVLIGEIRDEETAKIAIEASLTGHLVLATLHTNDAASAVTRLAEMGVEPYLVSSALTAVVGQRLVRRLCQYCRAESTMPLDQARQVGIATADDFEDLHIYEAKGCSRCQGSGYRSRMGVHEIIEMSPALSKMTLEGAGAGQLAEQAWSEGATSMRRDGWTKVREGFTTIEEVLRVVS